VIALAVRWYLRYGLSYRDLEELLAERGIEVDHVTISRWVQAFTAEFIGAARPARHELGGRWFADETHVKVAGRWIYLYRAVDQHGQVIDILVSERRDGAAARASFTRALKTGPAPLEITTDRAPVYPRVIDELVPAARHICERHASNRVEADHGRLKARLRPRRGMETTHPLRSQPGARSCRTSAAATTKSPPTCPSTIVCMSRHRARALPLTAAINAPAAALSPSINAAAP
jgi:IS6 family transposase